MVDSVVSFVLKVSGDWGRKLVTQKLRSGGAFAQSLSKIIEREMCNIKRQLKALTRKDLDESIDLFLEGFASISLQANDNKADAGPSDSKRRKVEATAHCFDQTRDQTDAEQIVKLSFSKEAKKRFKHARKKAGSAIANEAMKTKDVILATLIKLLSQMLETDDLATAFSFCLHDLKQLHSRKDVKKNFEDVLAKKKPWLKAKVRKKARKIVWCVCRMNQFVFNMAQEAGEAERSPERFKAWPCVKIASHLKNYQIEIDPLRDPELSAIFKPENLAFSPIPPSSFGQNDAGEELRPQKPSERAETTPPSPRMTVRKRDAKTAGILSYETPETRV